MPEIISRREAQVQGLRKYFTGVACKNGHTAERYVQSATCEECIRESGSIVIRAPQGELLPPSPAVSLAVQQHEESRLERSELLRRAIEVQERKIALKEQAIALQREARRERKTKEFRREVVKGEMVRFQIVVYPEDYQQVVGLIWASAAMRDPRLHKEDVVIGAVKGVGAPWLYAFKCFPEDRENLYRVGAEFERRHESCMPEPAPLPCCEVCGHIPCDCCEDWWPAGDPR
jgi:hypothetical protein